MIVKYLFSSPEGDITLGANELDTPFRVTPSDNHPFLTLRDYFKAIKRFILMGGGRPLTTLLTHHLNQNIDLVHIDQLLIRSEKHGALYHLASVEIFAARKPVKLSLSAAISEKGKAWLTREYNLLKQLDQTFNLASLPRVYLKGEVDLETGPCKTSLAMFLSEWFEDYHEWHLSMDEKTKRPQVCIWDQKCGYRFASREESFEIYKQASKILTLYYDTQTYRQIYPWHHAAGDFVVKTVDGHVDVKLTTARKYGPLMAFPENETINPWTAIVYFFLNLTTKIRLDRLDGVGQLTWAGDFSLKAAIEGFFEALRIMESEERLHLGNGEDVLSLLKSFTREELYRLFHPLLKLYWEEDPGDFSVIKVGLEDHTQKLYWVIQNFRL